MARPPLFTYQDAVEQLLDFYEMKDAGRHQRFARRAIQTAYRDLVNRTRWNYLDRRMTINTVANSTTGTIAYDHTGGASERLLTLSGSTFPADANRYRIIINSVHYDIDTYESTTTVTLPVTNNPGADVAAGTTHNLYKNTYPLPADFRKIGRIYDVNNDLEISLVGHDVLHNQSVFYYDTPGTPWTCTIRHTRSDEFGEMELLFGPPPDSARAYDLLYEAKPRDLKIQKHSTGTCTVAGDATTVSFSSATLPTDLARGAVIRFADDSSNEPTSVAGGLDNNAERFHSEMVILSRDSTSQVTLTEAFDSTGLTTVKYTISDPIDLEYSAMQTALMRLAEYEFVRMTSPREPNEQARMHNEAMQAIRFAMEADQRWTYAQPSSLAYDRFSRTSITTDAEDV